MEPQSIFDLTPQEFEGAIGELGLPQSEADQLRRQYRRQNSMFAGLYGLLDRARGQDAEQGRVRADVLPMTRPEGMTGMEALLSGEAQLALPGGLLGAAEGATMGIDAPAAAYQGMIPSEDMVGEALGTAGMAMLGGGAVARPAGSVGMGGRIVDFEDRLLQQRRNEFLTRIQGVVEDVASGNYQRRLDEAALSFHREGLLPLQIGTRVTPPSTWDMPGDWRVSGYYVDPNEPRRFGYRLESTTGDVYDAAVSDPQLGYALNNPTVFNAGFRAFAGPQREALQYRNLPERSQTSPAPDVTQEDLDRINQEYSDLFGETISANRSTATGAVGLLANESRAQQIARMLREGRGDEITEDMLAALDANDNMELADLYASGATGMDMPMDYESRMARAAEMGLFDDQYHATTADFPAFFPSQTGLSGRGVYTGDSATDVLDYARVDGDDGLNVIPVRTPPTGDYARRIDWQNLIDTDPEFPWNATVDETVAGFLRAAETMSGWGHAGVHSQPGERVTFYPRNVRSRFARFDPRLRNSANLLAANASPELGLLAASAPSEQEQLDQLRAYLGLLAQ